MTISLSGVVKFVCWSSKCGCGGSSNYQLWNVDCFCAVAWSKSKSNGFSTLQRCAVCEHYQIVLANLPVNLWLVDCLSSALQ